MSKYREKVQQKVHQAEQEKRPVAAHAKPRHKGLTKQEKRLESRLADYERVGKDRSKGWTRPGSLQ